MEKKNENNHDGINLFNTIDANFSSSSLFLEKKKITSRVMFQIGDNEPCELGKLEDGAEFVVKLKKTRQELTKEASINGFAVGIYYHLVLTDKYGNTFKLYIDEI